MKHGKGASFFMVCSGHWTISLVGWLDLNHASPVHITPGSCMLGGDSVDMAFLLVPVKAVTFR